MSLSINHVGRRVCFDFTTVRDSDLRLLVEQAAQKLYGYFLPSESQEPFVTICYTDHISDYFDSKSEECIQSETAQMNSHQALVGGHGDRLLYDYEGGRLCRLFFEVNMPSRFANEKNRATSRAFMSAVEQQVNSFYTRGYLCGMQQVNIEQVALEGFGSSRYERRIILSPNCQQGRLMSTEILLELWTECNIRAIVQNEVVLHLGAAWLADIIMKKKSLFRVVPRKDATGNVSVFHICLCLLNWNLLFSFIL